MYSYWYFIPVLNIVILFLQSSVVPLIQNDGVNKWGEKKIHVYNILFDFRVNLWIIYHIL